MQLLGCKIDSNILKNLRNKKTLVCSISALVSDDFTNVINDFVLVKISIPLEIKLFESLIYSSDLAKTHDENIKDLKFVEDRYKEKFNANRYSSFRRAGKSITSFIDTFSVSNITKRSTPIPTPAVGGMPDSTAWRKFSIRNDLMKM